MDLPASTSDLLALLERNGWCTAAFQHRLSAADWPSAGLAPVPAPAPQPDGAAGTVGAATPNTATANTATACTPAVSQGEPPAGAEAPAAPPAALSAASTAGSAAHAPTGPHALPAAPNSGASAGGGGVGGGHGGAHAQGPLRTSDLVAAEAAVAYGRIRRYVRHTPLEPSPWLSNMANAAAGASAGAGITGGVPGGGARGASGVSGASAGGRAGCRVAIKLESEQHSGSFKVRGALNRLLSLPREVLDRGVITASTGNHALAVLFAAATLSDSVQHAPADAPPASAPGPAAGAAGAACARPPADGGGAGACPAAAAAAVPAAAAGLMVRPVLYVPETASPYKLAKLRDLGGHVVLHGTDCLDSETAARAAAAAAGAVYVSPYNDPWVMGGQGTLALELLAARRRGCLDVVFVPVGGGGLIGGVASVLKAADPGIWVVGCQPAASDVMARSVAAGSIQPELDPPHSNIAPAAVAAPGSTAATAPTTHETGTGTGAVVAAAAAAAEAAAAAAHGTLSDATAGGVEAGSATLQPCTDCVDEWVTVREDEIAEAMVAMIEQHSKLVEGAAACALAAFARLLPRLAGKWVVVVACGGNVALHTLRRAMDLARPVR